MGKLSRSWTIAVVTIAGWILFAALFSPLVATSPQAMAQETPKPAWTPLYYGVDRCASAGCHGSRPEKSPSGQPDLLCRCDEAKIWKANDRHGLAYEALTSELGRQMGERLKIDVTQSKECLACHAVNIENKALRARCEKLFGYDIKEGVSCAGCHGAALEWAREHGNPFSAPLWREKTPEEKERDGGMVNLWDPIKRAELCSSCHIGDLRGGQKKFVTHEMYAAGHPPLPSFEMGAFSNEMPRHWEYRREKKSRAVRQEQGYEEGDMEQTKGVLVGAAIALRESMALVLAHAQENGDPKDEKALDWAHFDCYSCHHNLTSPAWKQLRPQPGKVGRPPMRQWPIELVRLSTLLSEDAKKDAAQLDDLVTKLQAAYVQRVGGDRKAIAAQAQELQKWSDGIARKIKTQRIERSQAVEVLTQLRNWTTDRSSVFDYDTARQVSWAVLTIQRELGDIRPQQMDDRFGIAFPVAYNALDDLLKLQLPTRSKPNKDYAGEQMRARYTYDPEEWKKRLAELKP